MITNCIPFALNASVILTAILVWLGMVYKKQYISDVGSTLIIFVMICGIMSVLCLTQTASYEEKIIPVQIKKLTHSAIFIQSNNILCELPTNNIGKFGKGYLIVETPINFLESELSHPPIYKYAP